jgi:hypothetical protein
MTSKFKTQRYECFINKNETIFCIKIKNVLCVQISHQNKKTGCIEITFSFLFDFNIINEKTEHVARRLAYKL